ncbi:type IV pilus modification protein PilV [Psychrobacter sp. S4(2024)]|uniref:type IV pilus modification protein PilV n=1 Tax=Psychrobacter sp. S4(2024) TaxID=3111913 RepID=UPI002FE3E747
MSNSSSQSGVGLIEVMVAILLLSIAVLGFSALQMRAINATDESLVRTKSLTLVRNLAEVMRAYPEAYVTVSGTDFTSAAPPNDEPLKSGALSPVPTVQAVITNAVETSVTVDSTSISISSCIATACNINQLVAREALLIQQTAAAEDVDIAVVTCPDTTEQAIQKQMCVITAWNDTKAILSDADTGDNANACANINGVYKTGSHCLISEAY